MNLTDKLYILYAELTSIENAFEQKKKIDFALELNSDINYRKKIIEKTNNYFYNKIIDAIKKIETNNYSSEKFTKTLFKKIIDIDFYKSKIDSIDLDEFYKLGEKYESESELIQKAKKQFNIEFLIQYFEIIQLLNSYDFYTNKIPKKDKITSFNRDLIKGIACLQEKLDLNELERIFKDTKSESFFRDSISFYLEGADYKTISESKKGGNKIDLKVSKNKDVYKIEFKGWWNDGKKEIISQINQYLTDFDDYGFIFMINDKQKRINEEYFELIKNDTVNYVKDSLSPLKIDNFEIYHSSHFFSNNIKKKLFHFIFNIHKN